MSSITRSWRRSASAEPTAAAPPNAARETGQVRPAKNPAAAALLQTSQLAKSYRKGGVTIPVLSGVDLRVSQGQFLAIVGQSGSGKSTLLHLMATLDSPDAGAIYFEGNRIDNLSSAGRDVLRNNHFGMIFQFYHLLPELTTLENVLLPLMIGRGPWAYWRSRHRHHDRARHLLALIGLEHRLRHRPRELSGGEMQRVAIARALVTEPRILLADEPTGNLDRHSGQEILHWLRALNQRENLTIVMVTHDHSIAGQADRVFQLTEGKLHEPSCP
jgi:lipoprotein-releasing system ATP-binding protein